MAAPVQTWGSLGSMVPEQQAFGAETAEYLEKEEVHDLFAELLRQVLVHRPERPLQFLREQLQQAPKLTACVISPPGMGRSGYCQQLAADLGLEHVCCGQLLRARPELKAVMDSGALVEDDVVIGEVKKKLAALQGRGWVLDGFPRTKAQAQALAQREMGGCLDRVLLLHSSEAAVRERFLAKAQTGGGAAEAEEVVERRLQQYQRHVSSVAELLRNVLRRVDAGGEGKEAEAYAVMRRSLHVRPGANAPLRPHRLCVLGPASSGRSTQCALLAKSYGLVHVDPAQLLLRRQRELSVEPEEVPLEHVGDEELCAVVGRRLAEVDCQRKGWVLDGFPRTGPQAQFLRQAQYWPTRLLHLRVEEGAVASRAATRKVDPLTAAAHYGPPAQAEVAAQLVQAEHDQPEKLRERYGLHMESVERVQQAFPMVFQEISGAQEIPVVAQALREAVDAPPDRADP